MQTKKARRTRGLQRVGETDNFFCSSSLFYPSHTLYTWLKYNNATLRTESAGNTHKQQKMIRIKIKWKEFFKNMQ